MDDCLEQWRGSIEGARRFPLGRYGNGSMFDMALHFKWGINRLGNFDEKIVTIIGGARVLPNWKSVGDWFKAFHKDCPSGYLTLTDFQLIYAQYFPAGDSSTFAEHVFRSFDRDGDQKVSFGEFLTALSVTARQPPNDKVAWAFDLYDMDRDGFISKQEMLEIVRSIYRMIGPAIRVPEDESTAEKRTNKIFHQFDRDRDERLSKEEFFQGALTDPSIVQLLENDKTPVTLPNPAVTHRLRT